jgi:hypothetical protein
MLRAFGLAASLALVSAGCGSGDGTSGTSGVSGSKPLTSLTDTEKGQLCDWMVAKFGGYGTQRTCDSPLFSYPDQAACVADSPSPSHTPNCQATVAQMEACVNSLPPCPTLLDGQNSPQCVPVGGC